MPHQWSMLLEFTSCTCVTAVVANQGAFSTEGSSTQFTGVVLLFTVSVHMCSQDVGLIGSKTGEENRKNKIVRLKFCWI